MARQHKGLVALCIFAVLPAASFAAGDPRAEDPLSHGWALQFKAQDRVVLLSDAEALAPVAFAPDRPQSPIEWRDATALSLTEVLALTRQQQLLHRAALSRAAVQASSGAMAVASLEHSGIWVSVALRAIYHANPQTEFDSEPQDLVVVDADHSEFEISSSSLRNMPRQMKDLFVGPLRKLWDEPKNEFLPSQPGQFLFVYPTPGPAALVLLTGGCALGRRRR
jgi:hypothetical protein